MRRIIALLAIAAVLFGIAGHLEAAVHPSPEAHPAYQGYGSCAYVQFITVYEPRIGRSYAVGAQAWCGGSGSWRSVVGCSATINGPALYTAKGPWVHSYWSVRRCPTTWPYAQWASYDHSTQVYGFARRAGALNGGRPAILAHQYPTDCFHRKVSWTLDYTTGTCGWVPLGASFAEAATCQAPDGHRYTVYGVRRWYAYQNSTATCPGLAEMVGIYNVKFAS